MTQIGDLIKKMSDFFTSEEFSEKGEDARLELSPDDVRYMCYIIRQRLYMSLEQEPCEDCISRDMVLEKMADYVTSGYADSAEDFEEYSRIICQLPPVTPQQKTGHWTVYAELTGEWEGTKKYACDKCGEKVGVFKSNFCPNCGAKMQEVEE